MHNVILPFGQDAACIYVMSHWNELMKEAISILLISMSLLGCINKDSIDCAEKVDGELITDFKVSNVHLGEKSYTKYLTNEDEYYGKILELKAEQVGDTLIVKYLKLGGNAMINCVEIRETNNRIDLINYESNYLKEISIREIEYRIQNSSKLKLGSIDFIEL